MSRCKCSAHASPLTRCKCRLLVEEVAVAQAGCTASSTTLGWLWYLNASHVVKSEGSMGCRCATSITLVLRLCALMCNMACMLLPRTLSTNLGLPCSLHHALIALPLGAVSHVACAKRRVRSRSEVVSCYWLPFMPCRTCPDMLVTCARHFVCNLRSQFVVTDHNTCSNMHVMSCL